MRLEEACEPIFARHETFQLRYGWFKKAYEGVVANPGIFLADDSTVELGVGKNMVKAIRFWGRAARILADVPHPTDRRTILAAPSRIGTALLSDDGWDPYCEDPASLWLLHWWMLAPPSVLPVWWAAFNDFSAIQFWEDDISRFVTDLIAATPGWEPPHESSITKDVTCMLRTYGPSWGGPRTGIDDLLDCPFRELGLLTAMAGPGRKFRFVPGTKPTLPPAVILFASLDFVSRAEQAGGQTVTVSRLSTEPGGPGRIFRLTEAALISALEAAIQGTKGVKLASPAGVTQLHFGGAPDKLASSVLTNYFAERRAGLRDVAPVGGRQGDLPVLGELTGAIAK